MSVEMLSLAATNPYAADGVVIQQGDALGYYREWPSPVVIISDGAYGVSGFEGDTPSADGLREWYAPHVTEWSARATPETTLWFWNTELGWATVHPLLIENGWEYRNCHIWNKGKGHIAGNANSKTLRKFPVVSEVCVQYTKKTTVHAAGRELTLKEWLRFEWERSGIPLSKANEACGVRNAATRKYFTKDHLWYFPPPEAFQAIVDYVNKLGDPKGRPYFSLDGQCPLTGEEWSHMRAKFDCAFGVTNVWDEQPMRGGERLKQGNKALHLNQKPLRLMELIVESSSDPGDVVWEPFGGLCTGAMAARSLNRRCFCAEINPFYFGLARARLSGTLPLARIGGNGGSSGS